MMLLLIMIPPLIMPWGAPRVLIPHNDNRNDTASNFNSSTPSFWGVTHRSKLRLHLSRPLRYLPPLLLPLLSLFSLGSEATRPVHLAAAAADAVPPLALLLVLGGLPLQFGPVIRDLRVELLLSFFLLLLFCVLLLRVLCVLADRVLHAATGNRSINLAAGTPIPSGSSQTLLSCSSETR